MGTQMSVPVKLPLEGTLLDLSLCWKLLWAFICLFLSLEHLKATWNLKAVFVFGQLLSRKSNLPDVLYFVLS